MTVLLLNLIFFSWGKTKKLRFKSKTVMWSAHLHVSLNSKNSHSHFILSTLCLLLFSPSGKKESGWNLVQSKLKLDFSAISDCSSQTISIQNFLKPESKLASKLAGFVYCELHYWMGRPVSNFKSRLGWAVLIPLHVLCKALVHSCSIPIFFWLTSCCNSCQLICMDKRLHWH